MTPGDLDELRDIGFDDTAIHDATQVIGYFNYINRVADALGVDPEDRLASADVGAIDRDTAIEATRTKDGGVEHVRAVGRRDDDDALVRLEAVPWVSGQKTNPSPEGVAQIGYSVQAQGLT